MCCYVLPLGGAVTQPTVDRRTFLAIAAAVAAGAGLAACGASGGRREGGPPGSSRVASTKTAGTSSRSLPPTGGLSVPDAADWAQLRSSLSGRLILPGDSDYLGASELYDPRFDSVRPAAVAMCGNPSDVQRCLGFSRDHALDPIARSGGHSYGGYSTGTGLVIDVSAMGGVAYNSARATATVGSGARLIDVYSKLNGTGVSIPAGSCPTVGIAGLTLGGGIGVVDRSRGLTCDALVSLQIVTADGTLHSVDAAAESDLFWACRGGGGGNFGIVTSFEFATFPTAPLTLFSIGWPWSAASQVLAAWMEWAPPAPEDLWSNCLLQSLASSPSPTVGVGGVWSGTPSDLTPLLTALTSAVGGSPSYRNVATVPFGHAMYVEGGCATLSQSACHLISQGGSLYRQPSLAKSDLLDHSLSDAGVAAVISGIVERHSVAANAAVGYDSWGGAINRVAPSATAFVHRSSMASAQYNVDFSPGTPEASLKSSQSFLDEWYRELRPYVSGAAYQNYIDPGLANWAQAYYGANFARLQEVKKAVDPDDVFHFAQSIPLPP